MCPSGTYSNATGLMTVDQCNPCTAGSYCEDPGLTEPTGLCDAGKTIHLSVLRIHDRFVLFFPMGIFLSRLFQNTCAFNMLVPVFQAEFLALCLPEHGMHRIYSSTMYNFTCAVINKIGDKTAILRKYDMSIKILFCRHNNVLL